MVLNLLQLYTICLTVDYWNKCNISSLVGMDKSFYQEDQTLMMKSQVYVLEVWKYLLNSCLIAISFIKTPDFNYPF